MNRTLPALLAACGGFLLAVLWMDLMFDVQAHGGSPDGPLPAAVVASISAYYRRVTTDAHPMNWLVGGVMIVTIFGSLLDLRSRGGRLPGVALLLALVPIGLAAVRIFPNAIALGAGTGDLLAQTELARAIWRDHLLCLAAISAYTWLRIVG